MSPNFERYPPELFHRPELHYRLVAAGWKPPIPITVKARDGKPDRAQGRGQSLTPSPVKQLALQRGLPVAQPATLKAPDARAALR